MRFEQNVSDVNPEISLYESMKKKKKNWIAKGENDFIYKPHKRFLVKNNAKLFKKKIIIIKQINTYDGKFSVFPRSKSFWS